MSNTGGDSGKPDEHERHVEDVDKKGKEEQLPKKAQPVVAALYERI